MATSAVPAFKEALYDLCVTTYAAESAAILVTYGHPGKNIPDDIVAVRNATSESEWAALGARSREERIDQSVVISCFIGNADQQAVTERAHDLLALLDAALRNPAGDPSIGNVVRQAAITSHELLETEPGQMDKGRIAEIQAVVTATVRI